MEKRPRRGPRGLGGAPFGGLPGQNRQTDFPLRILVQSDMVSDIFKKFCHFLYKPFHLLTNIERVDPAGT